ncbi:MAG: protein translocase subunit SecD [Thermoanaerobaculia bacterium]|nr:protein translocase subunit SecD [Thermoanaerobaculia bacterium]
MDKSLLWRGGIIVAVVLVAALSAYPLDESIKLGLDLRGGIHLVLEVQVEDALRSESDRDLEDFLSQLEERGLGPASGERTSLTTFEVTGIDSEDDEAVEEIAEEYLQGWDWVRRGEYLRFEMTAQNASEIRDLAVVQAEQTIRNRVDAFGVAEPVIQRQGIGGSRIVVQLPGVDDPERVKNLIKNTAFLEFRLVDYPLGGGCASSRSEVLSSYGGQLPGHLEMLEQDIRDEQGDVIGESYCAVQKRPVVTGRELKDARPGLGQFNQPVVNFSFTHEGGQRFAEATGENVGRGLAIVLDGRIITAPNIKSRIADRGVIEGSFTQEEVQDLSTVLRSGALPAAITYLEERTVGPSLGRDSIRQGLRAGLIGGVLVVVVILLFYRLTGINAVLALTLNIVLIFGCLAYFGATLTLPGIAGIVLTIGMAVDANVLVFERIKEELRKGRTVRSGVAAGFAKALSSILDANITTLIAALFLFQFGTGPIRGFAVTLSVGILASLFTAIFVSRWLFDLYMSRGRRVTKLSI